MASYVFNQVKGLIAKGQLNFSSDAPINYFKIALVGEELLNYNKYCTNTIWGNPSDPNSVASKEIKNATGSYTTQSKLLSGVNVYTPDNCGDSIIFANDITYNVTTVTAYGIILVKTTSPIPNNVINENDTLIAFIDITNTDTQNPLVIHPAVSNNGVFKIILNKDSGGFLTMK